MAQNLIVIFTFNSTKSLKAQEYRLKHRLATDESEGTETPSENVPKQANQDTVETTPSSRSTAPPQNPTTNATPGSTTKVNDSPVRSPEGSKRSRQSRQSKQSRQSRASRRSQVSQQGPKSGAGPSYPIAKKRAKRATNHWRDRVNMVKCVLYNTLG